MKEPISTKHAPAAVGPYSQAIRAGGAVYCSGQIGLDPASGQLVAGGVQEEAVQALSNLEAVLKQAGLGMDDIVKTTVLLADIEDFMKVNEVYAGVFTEPFPARAAFAVKDLPLGARVEIEAIAAAT